MKFTELFKGAGGMSLGIRAAGHDSHGIEWNKDAVATCVTNGLSVTHGDVRAYGPADFPDADGLAGGPPCQTFSAAGNGAGRRDLDVVLNAISHMAIGQFPKRDAFTDERTSLVLEPLRWTLEANRLGRPYRAVVLEQVPAVLPVWQAYAAVLEGLGYSVATGVLKAEQYGLPQTRRRAVLIARLDGEAQLPEPTHRAYRKGDSRYDGDPSLLPWVSMRSVLPVAAPFELVSNYGTGGDPKNRGVRTQDEPSSTISGRLPHLRSGGTDRVISYQEAGALQGFPLDWRWAGKQIRQQVGNACPVPLAAVLMGMAGS